ncbi:MAG: hypothetical protein H6817_02790 [Phycisphaerales bacterium]|nr:hypothetical protein [Phycisphaerales bacterium]
MRVLPQLILLLVAVQQAGCRDEAAATPKPRSSTLHVHTGAMLSMIRIMEQSGYHPAAPEKQERAFKDDPVIWLGPCHIAAPANWPYITEWRLTIYERSRSEQYHSFVSVEAELRFNDAIIAALIDEWTRMGPNGLHEEVVRQGVRLVRDAAERFENERAANSSSIRFLNDMHVRVDHYKLSVQFVDNEGFVDGEGVEPDFSRAILLFTYVD